MCYCDNDCVEKQADYEQYYQKKMEKMEK